MVSVYPNSQPYDLKHMYDMGDLRSSKKPKLDVPDNSTMGYINSSDHFSLFRKIVNKSRMSGKLGDKQFQSTLFAAPDSELEKRYPPEFFDNMDIGLAHNIISYSTMDRKMDKKILTASPIANFNTKNNYNKLCITNISGRTKLDSKVNIIHFNHPTDNGLVHIVDDLLYPQTMI